jgi:TRAP-type C4-dicarboxylate transport system permease small subunit
MKTLSKYKYWIYAAVSFGVIIWALFSWNAARLNDIIWTGWPEGLFFYWPITLIALIVLIRQLRKIVKQRKK